MLIHDSCSSAMESCVGTRTFAIARLYSEEKTMSIHIHDCYEVYFSISGGKQFLAVSLPDLRPESDICLGWLRRVQ